MPISIIIYQKTSFLRRRSSPHLKEKPTGTMSSRAMRKKHGRNDLEAIQKSLVNKENQEEKQGSGDGEHSSEEDVPAPVTRSKNVFALALVK